MTMLKSLKIINFKALRNTGDLEIKPLTFLIGPNSSGKTSIFHFLLALRQTSQHKAHDYPLILQDYLDLGSYKDVIFNHNENKNLKIKLCFEDIIGKERISSSFYYIFSFEKFEEKAGRILLKKIIYNGPFEFTEIIESKETKNDKNEEISERIYAKEWKFDNVKIVIARKPRTDYFTLKFKEPAEIKNKKIDIRIGQFHKITQVRHGPLIPFHFFDLPEKVIDFFDNLHHIGPLREEPQRVYTATGIIPVEVGRTGKRSIDAIITKPEKIKLIRQWLDKFNISSEINIEELKKGSNIYRIILKDVHTGINVNLADAGFGVSQVLPIIVEFLISPSNATILIEQPEIHLHPKAQAIMGELLADVVKGNKRKLIIETHSDLILSRVCTMIAQKKINLNNVAIYYFDPRINGTKILKIGINKNGQYEKFPEGFFEERYEEAMKRVKINKEVDKI